MTTNTRWCSTINRADSTHVDITEDREKNQKPSK